MKTRKKDATGKFRDYKGRIMEKGETQEQSGRYRYTYIGLDGKSHVIYSWRLEAVDMLPKGKRPCRPLREMEKEVKMLKEKGIVPAGNNLSVYELAQYYVFLPRQQRRKLSTQKGYQTILNRLKNDSFGQYRIDQVCEESLQKWLKGFQDRGELGYSSLNAIWKVLKPAFSLAVKKHWLSESPAEFVLTDIIKDDSVAKNPLTYEEKEKFLKFIKEDKICSRHYDEIYILFYTGLRISEFVGLTKSDIDLEKKTIRVNHQLKLDGNRKMIDEPKSEKGNRIIPMFHDVPECFRRILEKLPNTKKEPVIESCCKLPPQTGFIILNTKGDVTTARDWARYFECICKRYNKMNSENIYVTPHICRHTFCSNLAMMDINPMKLQYFMGHEDINTTLKVYTKLDATRLVSECEQYNAKMW